MPMARGEQHGGLAPCSTTPDRSREPKTEGFWLAAVQSRRQAFGHDPKTGRDMNHVGGTQLGLPLRCHEVPLQTWAGGGAAHPLSPWACRVLFIVAMETIIWACFMGEAQRGKCKVTCLKTHSDCIAGVG